ncbi:MAG: PilZ domain-containing protein [Phycisphaerae bacterium]|nr:PilZ domain-containing protein [Phycisphaerae bacterium]
MKRTRRHVGTPYQGAERRRHKRFAVPCPVRLSQGDAAEATGKTANVSDGGMLVPLPPQMLPACGNVVDVLLRVPRQTPNTYMLEEFVSRARVVRYDALADREGAGAALEFVHPMELGLEV